MNSNTSQLLKKNILAAESSAKWLKRSFKKCEKINFSQKISEEEMDQLEALTSRFARLVDILIHKVFRGIEIVELEVPGTIIDTVHRMEKRGLIKKTEDIKLIKDLRNTISHEYEETQLIDLMKECLDKSPLLFDLLDKVKKYCDNKKLL